MIFTETKILVHFYKNFRDIIIIFHDFPGPWLFSMTFQAWKMVLLNSMTFQEVVTLLFEGRGYGRCFLSASYLTSVIIIIIIIIII